MSVIFNIGLYHYLILALILFCIGLWGVIACKDLIKVFLCVNLMMFSAALNYSAYAVYVDPEKINGVVVAIFIIVFGIINLVVSAALLISVFKYKKNLDVEKITDIKG